MPHPTWEDLDIAERTISVTKTLSAKTGKMMVSPPKTQNSIRKVVIPTEAVELLVEEHEKHPDSPYMFPSPVTGNMYHPDAIGRVHKKLLKQAGLLDIRFHDASVIIGLSRQALVPQGVALI